MGLPRTRTSRRLSPISQSSGLQPPGEKGAWCSHADSNRDLRRFKGRASAIGLGELVLRVRCERTLCGVCSRRLLPVELPWRWCARLDSNQHCSPPRGDASCQLGYAHAWRTVEGSNLRLGALATRCLTSRPTVQSWRKRQDPSGVEIIEHFQDRIFLPMFLPMVVMVQGRSS